MRCLSSVSKITVVMAAPELFARIVAEEAGQRPPASAEEAVALASDGTPGRDRKAQGLTNLAKQYLEEKHGEVTPQNS